MSNPKPAPLPAHRPSGQDEAVQFAAVPGGRFQLLRYFSLASLVGVLIVLTILIYFYRVFAWQSLEQHETQNNVALTQIFASNIWPRHAAYVQSAGTLSTSELQQRPEVAQIRADVLHQMKGLAVVKVKIYDLSGRTVFSTDPQQIGEGKQDNAGFLAARNGHPVSEITFRNQFAAFEKVINDRSLISSYIPIRSALSQAPEGVFEVYSDVTAYVDELERATYRIVALVLASLGLLYAFLFAIVRRADGMIQSQSDAVDRAHQTMLERQALHDPLTGLPNREHLSKLLAGLLKSVKPGQAKCALLHIGLDAFKPVNESLGLMAGDQVLQTVGLRLAEQFRESRLMARVGGDEFVVVVADLDPDREVELILQTVARVRQAVSAQPIEVNGQALRVSASIGVAICPDDGDTVPELLKSAGHALSHAKKSGHNSCQFHTADMNTHALNQLVLERDLRQALIENQFVLHYQPQIDLSSATVIGAEALIRWQHPQRGLLSPAHFIALAEERHLIVPLGEWVLRETCRQMRAWHQAGLPRIPIAVNLSAQHFKQTDLAADVVNILGDFGLPAACLELELTESSVLQDTATSIATMKRLKEAGVLLALDDFGTGYSSLSQLKGLPLDGLKLDQSFVRGLPDDRDDLAICTAVIAMGHALGMKVLAEGVETAEQLAVLRALGCDQAQGYFFAKPMPAEALFQFVMSQRD